MSTTETPTTTPTSPAVGRKRALLAGGALVIAVGTAAVIAAIPAQAAVPAQVAVAAGVSPAPSPRGSIDSAGNCHIQPAAAKTSTVQAERFLKTEPITLTVKTSVDANCNLTYTVSTPDKGRAVKSWALSASDSYPNGLAGQQKSNATSQTALSATDTFSVKDMVAMTTVADVDGQPVRFYADNKLNLRIFVEYEGTATEGAEYSTYFVDVPVY